MWHLGLCAKPVIAVVVHGVTVGDVRFSRILSVVGLKPAASSNTICCNYSIVLGLLLASPQSDGHNCRTGRTAGNFHFVMVSVLRKDKMVCQLTRI